MMQPKRTSKRFTCRSCDTKAKRVAMIAIRSLLKDESPFVKGGVGKTSMACAAAVQLADRGLQVLLVSTDPASNLDEVLGTNLGNEPTAIESVQNLFAMNIDPETAASEYRERMVGPYRGVLSDTAVASMEEQFSGSCTLEIAAFDEFAKLLGDKDATSSFDHVMKSDSIGRSHAYLWRGSEVIDLEKEIDSQSGWDALWSANVINNSGVIAGWGRFDVGCRGYLLIPNNP